MKTIITLLLVCITSTGFGKSKQAYKKLCEVNKCWREQPDVNQIVYPEYDNRSEQEWIRTHLSMVNALAHLNQDWQ